MSEEERAALVPVVLLVEGALQELVAIGEQYWSFKGFDEVGTPRWNLHAHEIDTGPWPRRHYVLAAAGTRAMVPTRSCSSCKEPLSLTSRAALEKLAKGIEVSCVDCDGNLLDAVARLKKTEGNPASATRSAGASRQGRRAQYNQAFSEWKLQQHQVIADKWPVQLQAEVTSLPEAPTAVKVAVLAMLRHALTVNPITPIGSWPSLLHPDGERTFDLLRTAYQTGLVDIHPSSEPEAFVWDPKNFDEQVALVAGDLDAVGLPHATGSFYLSYVHFYVPFGPSLGTAVTNTTELLSMAIDPTFLNVAQRAELLELVRELLAAEAVRFLDHWLDDVNLPPCPKHHRGRITEAAQKAARTRSLGDLLALAWRSAQYAAVNAQRHPHAPRPNMSTSGVNRYEEHLQKLVTDPEFTVKPFTTLYGQELSAMTKVVFHNVVNLDPLITALPQIEQLLAETPYVSPLPASEEPPDPRPKIQRRQPSRKKRRKRKK